MKPIQVLKPRYRVEECLAQIEECLRSGWTGPGGKTIEFEKAFCEYTGLPHAHFLSSATAGLHLAVKILKLRHCWADGAEIISTPLTFVSTNHAILYEGMTPVFADVHPDTLCLDPESIKKKITPRTRAVMYVGIGGNPGQLDEVAALCRSHGLKLILDAAHMAGTKMIRTIDGIVTRPHVGQEADVTVFSFQAVKNLPTADGGMICFQEAGLDAVARKLSWLGIDKDTHTRTTQRGAYKWKYDVPKVGYKYHGNAIMAAIGLVQLKYLDVDNYRRLQIAHKYNTGLQDVVKTYYYKAVNSPSVPSHHLFQISVPDRDRMITQLNAVDIYPGVHYITNTSYRMFECEPGSLPVADKLSSELLTLPIHLEMTDEDVDRVIQEVRRLT